jgi:hypothetical protein
MNAKRLLLMSCIAALALPASVANGQRRAGGGGRAHVGSMPARSAPSGAYRGTYGRNWNGRNWSGRNWSGRNWNNWNGNWRHHHGDNDVIFIGDFGFPWWWGWGSYYPWGYPYGYYGYGDGYGYGGYGYGGYGDGGYGDGGYGYNYGQRQSEYGYGSGTRSRVVELQRRLARAGYYNGSVDGVMGPQTRRAIRAYERDHGYADAG